MRNFTERPNLSNAIADRLRQMIFSGELRPGERLNEVHLARELGVSRTPLREALGVLVGEGPVSTEPRRGFFVRPLTVEEFQAIYPIRGLLDPEALRLAGLPPSDRLRKLNQLNEKLVSQTRAEAAIDLDDRWHFTLIETCPNPILVDLIRQFMARTRRYELAYFRENTFRVTAANEHKAIIEALEAEDLAKACGYLKQNLTSGTEPITDWLKRRMH